MSKSEAREQQRREFLASVEEHVAAEVRRGLPSSMPHADADTLAARLGKSVTTHLSITWGGQQIYFPMDAPSRNARIYDAFDGSNHAELAHEYHMSLSTIYGIIRQETARRRLKQGSLLEIM